MEPLTEAGTSDLKVPESYHSHFRLISVSFKEAALDSPSFRASINHSDNQLTNISQWLPALHSSLIKIPKKVEEVRAYFTSFIEHLTPGFVQDGIIDQEVTVPLLKEFSDANKRLFNLFMSNISYRPETFYRIIKDFNSQYSKYVTIKGEFDVLQKKYDQYLSVYMSSPKIKSPESSIEDALQLYLCRKSYLHASLDLVIITTNISSVLDIGFTTLGSTAWGRNVKLDPTGGILKTFEKESFMILRAKTWCISYANAMKSLESDVLDARKQVELSTTELFEPSKDPNDYRSSLINNRTLEDIDEPACEKHGYLLMKTYINPSPKPVWVKRWGFIKNGLFGLLILSPSKTFVQETDKIGILTMHIRYAAQEERRFCFEIKTIDTTVTFQAESLIELKSWFKVFNNEINRVKVDANSIEYKMASSRYPPLITEFASTVDTVIDRQLTNTRIKNSDGQIITSATLSSNIQANEKYFQENFYARIPSIRPALSTSNTKTAIIAYSIATTTGCPSALTANIWGSVNWGLYYMQHKIDDFISKKPHDYFGIPAEVEDNASLFNRKPLEGYPDNLVSLDTEMRAIFESVLEGDEVCLLSFTSLWTPSENREISCRFFVTNKSVLLCNQAVGFTSLFTAPLSRLMSVETEKGQDFDYLMLHFYDNSVKMKVFMESGPLVQQKLSLITQNLLEDKPKTVNELLKLLMDIEDNFSDYARPFEHHNSRTYTEDLSPSIVDAKVEKIIQYYPLYDAEKERVLFSQEFPVPAKAMFHILFGDNSSFIRGLDGLEDLAVGNTPWTLLSDGRLVRTVYSCFMGPGIKTKRALSTLAIEQMIENEYYNVSLTKKWYSFYGSKFSLNYRSIIRRSNFETCTMSAYASLTFVNKTPANLIAKPIFEQVQNQAMNHYHQKLSEVCELLGTNAPLARAIFLYGRISQTTAPQVITEEPICQLGLRLAVSHYILKPVMYAAGECFHCCLRTSSKAVQFIRQITAQRLLIAIIIGLSLFNIFLLSKTTKSYWETHSAFNYADQMLNSEPRMLQRAVFLKDLHEITKFTISDYDLGENISADNDSKVLESFQGKSFVRNLDIPVDWESEYSDSGMRQVAVGLRKTFQEIGIKRHKLLIEFNILNQMEVEVAKGEWRNWLMSELQRCSLIQSSQFKKALTQFNSTEAEEGIKHVKEYCSKCAREFESLNLL